MIDNRPTGDRRTIFGDGPGRVFSARRTSTTVARCRSSVDRQSSARAFFYTAAAEGGGASDESFGRADFEMEFFFRIKFFSETRLDDPVSDRRARGGVLEQ